MDNPIDRTINPSSLICFKHAGQGLVSIPELKLYKNLTELDLSENCFEGEIPEIVTLKYLRRLSLASNHINTFLSLPTSLEYLNISCNYIESIPEFMLQRLVYLDISCNLLSDLSFLRFFPSLRTLSIGYNLITSIDYLYDSTNLLEINLEHNLIDDLKNFHPLITSSVLVFIIKNNPIYLQKATSLNCRLIKEGYGGNSNESIKINRVKYEYLNHVSQKNIIKEEDEYQETLINEVENLRKIINENENKYQKLEKKSKKNILASKSCAEIEKKIMRLHELEKEKEIESTKKSKIDKIEYNYRAKYVLLDTTTKRLKENYKKLKNELMQKISEIDKFELEKCRMLSDVSYLEQENQRLLSDLEVLKKHEQSINSQKNIGKKVLKSSSTKSVCKSTIPKIRISSKDSLIVSPLSNVSLPTVTQFSKRRDSNDKDNSRILRALPTSKGKPTPVKIERSKN